MRDDADERADEEVRAERVDRLERTEHVDVRGLDADLFLGLAQRGREQRRVGVGDVTPARETTTWPRWCGSASLRLV